MKKLVILNYNDSSVNIFDIFTEGDRKEILSRYNEDEISWMYSDKISFNYA